MNSFFSNSIKIIKQKLSYTQMIALGFLAVIITGTVLLSLPCSSRSGEWTPFINSLFTATSATCVTGLSVYDTCMHWSLFGQIVLIFLIQIGGLGFMTVITMLFLFFKKQISLHERRLLMQSAGDLSTGGVVQLIRRILLGTFIFEGLGIILLALYFCPKLGFFKGMWFAVFHSVSAFCNAGFDLMSLFGSSSFIACDGNVFVNLTLMALIIIGGIGFIVWNDVLKHTYHFRRYDLHTKIALVTSGILIISGAVLYYILEQNATLAGMSEGKQWLVSLFQSVTTRTAGFFTADLSKLSDSGSILSVVLMLIGGSPGSCAGGIKTTTFTVVCVMTMRYASNRENVVLFKRKIPEETVKQASAVVGLYLFVTVIATAIICAVEPFGIKEILFEVSSAIGTVGLTMGITSQFSVISKTVLIFLMYAGRLGGMSLVIALTAKKGKVSLNRPTERILVG